MEVTLICFTRPLILYSEGQSFVAGIADYHFKMPGRSLRISSLSQLVGRSVKDRRQQLGISQKELARRAGLGRTYLVDVERGARNLSLITLQKLAQALQMPVSALLRKAEEAMP